MENVGDVHRRIVLLRVDVVLDVVYVLTVGDVEDLAELESVGGVGSVACTEVILVAFCKQGETLCHAPLVKSIDVEHDGESLLHIDLENFTGELGHWNNASSALDLVRRVSGRVRTTLMGGGQVVVGVVVPVRTQIHQQPEPPWETM